MVERRKIDRLARVAITLSLVAVVMVLIVSGVLSELVLSNRDRGQDLAKEAETRTEQFCHLINASYAEHRKRYRSTVKYLDSKAGRERTGINGFIRAGLPQQRRELKIERRAIPDICLGVSPKPEPLKKPRR